MLKHHQWCAAKLTIEIAQATKLQNACDQHTFFFMIVWDEDSVEAPRRSTAGRSSSTLSCRSHFRVWVPGRAVTRPEYAEHDWFSVLSILVASAYFSISPAACNCRFSSCCAYFLRFCAWPWYILILHGNCSDSESLICIEMHLRNLENTKTD